MAIGLFALGDLFLKARVDPLGVDRAFHASETIEGLREFLMGHGDRFVPLASKLPLADHERVAEGIREFQLLLFGDDGTVRDRLARRLTAEDRFHSPVVMNSVIDWTDPDRSNANLRRFYRTDLHPDRTYPPKSCAHLVEALAEIHPSQLTGALAVFREEEEKLDEAGWLYAWYLILHERIPGMPTEHRAWGEARFEALSGRLRQVGRTVLDASTSPHSGEVSAVRRPSAAPAQTYSSIRSYLGEIAPEDDDLLEQVRFTLGLVPRESGYWRDVSLDFAVALSRWVDAMELFLGRHPQRSDAAVEEFEALRRQFPRMPPAEGTDIEFDTPPLEPAARGAAGHSQWTIDLMNEVHVAPKKLIDLIEAQLAEINPGDTIIITYSPRNLAGFQGDIGAVFNALQGSERLGNLGGGEILLRGIGFQVRLTLDLTQSPPKLVQSSLGPAPKND